MTRVDCIPVSEITDKPLGFIIAKLVTDFPSRGGLWEGVTMDKPNLLVISKALTSYGGMG